MNLNSKTPKQLKSKLTKVFHEYVRLRDNNTCVLCGTTQQPNAGHVLSCRKLNTRWDEINVFCQCWKCNFKHTYDTVPYFTWYIDKFGRDAFDELYLKWNSTFKPNKSWLIEKIEFYQQKVKAMKHIEIQYDLSSLTL